MYLFFPVAMLGMIITQFGQAAASADRIFEILDARNDIVDKPDAIALPDVRGEVKFEDVTFRYFGGGEPVLKNVTFEAAPGERIALLGATGSGKSTIINLLPRFYDPTEGRITIDNHDLRDVKLESLRSQIGIVLQETTLFSGSIRENIAFGKPDATQEEIEAAAKAAQAHDFIMSFPQGYDTHVGERGQTLSGGQKQRVAIARALLLDPRILILDDSTSSVDLATESLIQVALDKLMEGRTSFVIAQRISTVMTADKILVLDKGEVVAWKACELMENEPIYAEIYNSQILSHEAESASHQVYETDLQPIPFSRCFHPGWCDAPYSPRRCPMMHGGGRMQGLLDNETLKPRNLGETLSRLGSYFGRFWPMLLLALVFVVISTWTQVTTPDLTGQATDCFLVPLGAGGSFGFLGGMAARQTNQSASNCWLATDDPSTLSLTHKIIYNAYTMGGYPAPDPAALSAEGAHRRTCPPDRDHRRVIREQRAAQRHDLLRHGLERAARAARAARGGLRAPAQTIARLLQRKRSRRPDEPHHQRHQRH
jgi:energy-coupling factor transporter ATP-binding protein EcfA2